MLVKLFQLQPAPVVVRAGAAAPPVPELPAPPVQPGPPDPQLQPTWQPDAAAGAAWLTAGDAAAGAPATGWGTPGSRPMAADPGRSDAPPAQPPAAGAADDQTARVTPVDAAGPDEVGEQPAKPANPAPHWWSDQA